MDCSRDPCELLMLEKVKMIDCEPPPQKEGCSHVGTMFEKPWPMMAQCQGMLALENTIEIMAVSTHYKLILYKELFYMFHAHSCPHCYLALTRWVPSFPLQQ